MVSESEGRQFAERFGLDAFFETSAKSNHCVAEAFERTAELVYQKVLCGTPAIRGVARGLGLAPPPNGLVCNCRQCRQCRLKERDRPDTSDTCCLVG